MYHQHCCRVVLGMHVHVAQAHMHVYAVWTSMEDCVNRVAEPLDYSSVRLLTLSGFTTLDCGCLSHDALWKASISLERHSEIWRIVADSTC
jgi:hypothetical protein